MTESPDMASDLGRDAPPPRPKQQAFDSGALPKIRQSAASLARDQDAFIEQFRADVSGMVSASAVPPAFDMRAFCDRMGRALLWAALTDQPPTTVAEALRQLGAQNLYAGFPDSQYPSVARALVQAVRYLTVNAWSASTGSAWIGFFMSAQSHLVAGAQDAAAYEEAARDATASEAAAQRGAAEEEAARVTATSQGRSPIVNNANLKQVADLPEDEEEEEEEQPGLGQIMLDMTRDRLRRSLPCRASADTKTG